MIQREEERGKKIEFKWTGPQRSKDNIKQSTVCVIGVPSGKEGANGTGKLFEEMSGAQPSWERGLGCQVLERQIKATCGNERVKPLTVYRDGRSRKLKLTVLSFIFPMKRSTSWESGGSEQTWRSSHSWESPKQQIPAVGRTLESGEGWQEGLRVEENWALSQSGDCVFRFSPSSSPTRRPRRPRQRHLRKQRAAWISRFAVGNDNQKAGRGGR